MSQVHYTTEEVDSLIATYFLTEDSLNNRCLDLFFQVSSRYDISSYDGRETTKLLRALKVVNSALGAVDSDQLNAVIRSLARGLNPNPILLQPTSTLSHVFLNKLVTIWACQENGILDESTAEAIVAEWRRQALEGLNHLEIYSHAKTFVQDANVLLSLKARVSLLKSIFTNDPVKKAFLDLLEEIKTQAGDKHVLYPSGFICSPSGSGKTTLVQHLCCGNFPAAFTLFTASKGIHQPVQQVYKPFLSISAAFVQAQMEDLASINALFEPKYNETLSREIAKMERKMRARNQPVPDLAKLSSRLKKVYWCSYLQGACMFDDAYKARPLKYQTVGFIVALFKRLVADRANNQQLTWLELQCNISSLSFAPMSILEGLKELKSLADTIPLMLFVDECCLRGTVLPTGLDDPTHRFQLLRSISRCLNIAVIFSGTDARASNLTLSFGSGSGGQLNVERWLFVFNVLPSYDSTLLESRCQRLTERFESCPRLLAMVRLVQSVAGRELPWFIDLFLSSLESIVNVSEMEQDPLQALNNAIQLCQKEFIYRKTLSSLTGDYNVYFNKAQIAYICNFSWEDVTLPTNRVRSASQAHQLNINRHVGHLFGYPDKPEGSYFSLCIGTRSKIYFRAMKESNTECLFIPKSVFTSFYDAPITGLALFGLSTNIRCFMKRYKRTSVLNSLLTRSNATTTGKKITGANLEMLMHSCAIVASRNNELVGSNVVQFVGALVKELLPLPWNHPVTLTCSEPDLINANRHIPLLSPMTMSGWHPQLVELLKAINANTTLGVYRSTKANDRCDGVAYHYDPEEPFMVEMGITAMEAALKDLGHEQKYPKPLYPPTKRGRLMKIQQYPSRIAFIVECKQLSSPLSAAEIVSIVDEKFLKPKEFGSCTLFFLIAYRFCDIAANAPSMVVLDEYKRPKPAVFWYVNPTADTRKYSLTRVPLDSGIDASAPHCRHIVLLSLETIWGGRFGEIRDLFDRIPDQL